MTKSETKTIKLGDFVTDEMMKTCVELYPDAKAICEQVIKPNIETINKKLGQQNDERFLAYMIVAAIQESGRTNLN